MNCPQCGKNNSQGGVFCNNCGNPLPKEEQGFVFCSQCGKKNTGQAKFCQGCGKEIETIDRGAGPQISQPAETQPLTSPQVVSSEPKRKFLKKKLLVAGIIIVVLAVLIAGWFLFSTNPYGIFQGIIRFFRGTPEFSTTQNIKAEKGDVIELKGARLEIFPNALSQDTKFTVSKLSKDQAPQEKDNPEFKYLDIGVNIEPSIALPFDLQDIYKGHAMLTFEEPKGLSEEEKENLAIAVFENNDWMLLDSWLSGGHISANVYHCSNYSLVSLVKEAGEKLLQQAKDFTSQVIFKFLYSKVKKIVFFGNKAITFPLSVLEGILTPVGQDSTAPEFQEIFVYFYNEGLVDGYSVAQASGVKPSLGDWLPANAVPQKSYDEIFHIISEKITVSIVDWSMAVDYARSAYQLGFGWGFQQGVYDAVKFKTSNVNSLPFYIQPASQTITFKVQDGSVLKNAIAESLGRMKSQAEIDEELRPYITAPDGSLPAIKVGPNIITGGKNITRDPSQLALTQDEADKDFQISQSGALQSNNEGLQPGLEKGYQVAFASPGQTKIIFNSVLQYQSFEAAGKVFQDYLKNVPPATFLGFAVDKDVQITPLNIQTVGDESLAFQITNTKEKGLIFLYLWRKWNIIELLLVGSYDESFEQSDAENYARILERKIIESVD